MKLEEDSFTLLSSGEKSIEIRVNDAKRQKIRAGQPILFRCGSKSLVAKVKEIVLYESFEEMLEHEELSLINPYRTRAAQLDNLRRLYPPDKERLGVLAIRLKTSD